MSFDWDDEKADANLKKHGISFEEAVKVFDDPNAIEIVDEGHSTEESRFSIIGLAGLRLLYVVFTVRRNVIRIIHARHADRKMRRIYEEGTA